jgi:hypothetical protein
MKKFLLGVAIALASLTSFATTYVAEHGKDVLVLDDQALCPKAVQAIALQRGAPMDLVSKFRGFTAHMNGQELHGCWVAVEGSVALIWDDGDIGQVPQTAFHKAKEV